MLPKGDGFAVKYDTVRVAQGLMHMATDLRSYAAKVTCPVVMLRSTIGSEVSAELAPKIIKCWSNGSFVDVEGGYLLHVQERPSRNRRGDRRGHANNVRGDSG